MKLKYLVVLNIISLCCACASSDYTEDLGNGYEYIFESKNMTFISGPNKGSDHLIPCTIESFDYDNEFILVRQKDNPDCFTDVGHDIPNHFWIIDKLKNERFGPLDSISFINKKEALKISPKLKLAN